MNVIHTAMIIITAMGIQNPGYRTTKDMPQDDYNPINYTTGQPNSTPFVPGSQYVPPAPKPSEPSQEEKDEKYMKGAMDKLVKSRAPKPPKDMPSYRQAYEARKK